MLNLLDSAGKDVVEWYLHYTNSPMQHWWTRPLKDGFQHVQMYKSVHYGPGLTDRLWLHVDPGMEHIDTRVDFNPVPPWERGATATVQYVRSAVTLKKVREYFFLGTFTCVEVVKAHLGINAVFVRTPWQLYNYIRARNHVLR